MGIFDYGYDDVDDIAKEREERKANAVFRFWMPHKAPSNKTRIVFLDGDNPPKYEEHNVKMNGSWKNWFTCLKKLSKVCPNCASGNKPYLAAAYTIIDCTEWKDKQGNTHKNEKKLYVVKFESLKLLKEFAAKRKGLRGCVYEVMRTSDKAASTGNSFDFEYKMTEQELRDSLEGRFSDDVRALVGDQKFSDITPYDYEKVLAPKDPAEIEKALDTAASASYDGGDDIQF